jgi:hypothetical protein
MPTTDERAILRELGKIAKSLAEIAEELRALRRERSTRS